MAAAGGAEDPRLTSTRELDPVERELREHPGEFEFFQAVRLLLLLRRRSGEQDAPRPGQEPVRFSVHPARQFPPSAIHSIEADEQLVRMSVNFLGMTGPSAVLPDCYADLINERLRAKDTALAAFLDIFHHRILSLFYDSWEKYRFAARYERDGRDQVSEKLMALIGLATPGLQDRLAVPDQDLLFYTGLLSLEPRSASALTAILEDYFGVPVEVEQFVGAWVELEPEDCCHLEDTPSTNAQLGGGALAGDAVWDQQGRVRVKLGPLTAERYVDFLPGGASHRALRALASFFAPDLDIECQLILRREETPACELAREDAAGPRLGWFTWLKSGPAFGRDPADTFLLLSEGT